MGLSRQIFKHAAIYSAATVLGRLISFIMLPFYAHIFRAEGYGVIGMIDASLGLLAIIFASGFHTAIIRIYHEETEEKKAVVVSTAIRLIWGGGLAAICIPLLLSSYLSRILLGSDQYAALFVLALITFLVDVGGQSASTVLIIRQQSILYSAVNLIRLVVGLGLNIWLVLILKVGLIGVFISSLVTALVASALFLGMAIREHGLKYDGIVARKLLKFQLPLLPGDVVSFFSRQAERYLVRFLVDLRAVGILEMAYKFPPLLNLFITLPFTQAWRTKSIEIAHQRQDAPQIIGRMFTNYFFIMVFAGLVLAVSIDELLEIMTPREFWAAAGIAKVEIVTTIMSAANGLLMFGLMYSKRTGMISAVKISMAIIKIPLAFFMIWQFQLSGAAYSALIIEAMMMVAVLTQSQKYYRIEYEYIKLFLISIYAVLTYVLVINYGLANVVYVSDIKDAARSFMIDKFGIIPVAQPDSSGWLGKLVEREDAMISLVMDVGGSLIFLLAAPLLFFFPRLWEKEHIAGTKV